MNTGFGQFLRQKLTEVKNEISKRHKICYDRVIDKPDKIAYSYEIIYPN